MQKSFLLLAFFIFCGSWAFGDNDNQTELDFLLFWPDSSSSFENEEQAAMQLDKLAKDILNRNLNNGQIYVYGYSAIAPNDIDPIKLSRDRALFVINELQKRGLAKGLFADPVGQGEVNLWGSTKNDLKPNRRVRIVLDTSLPAANVPAVIDSAAETAITDGIPKKSEKSIAQKSPKTKKNWGNFKFPWSGWGDFKFPSWGWGNFKFPWWILIVLLIIAVIVSGCFFAAKNGILPSGGSGRGAKRRVEPENTNFSERPKSNPKRGFGQEETDNGSKQKINPVAGEKLDINLPSETVSALREEGHSIEEIVAISKDIGGSKDDIAFTPDKNDNEYDKVCEENRRYLENPSDEEKRENLVDPARREMLIKNYQLLKERKKGFIYKNGKFIGNMGDYAYRIASVKDLGLQSIPHWRYASGARDSDPSGRGRLGITGIGGGLGDILFARQNGLVSDDEMRQLKDLCPKVYNNASPCSDNVLAEFKHLSDTIIKRIPGGTYTRNDMQIHEDHDMHTLMLVPAGLHSTLPAHSNWRKLTHTGGQALAKKAAEIRENKYNKE